MVGGEEYNELFENGGGGGWYLLTGWSCLKVKDGLVSDDCSNNLRGDYGFSAADDDDTCAQEGRFNTDVDVSWCLFTNWAIIYWMI